MSAEDLSPSRRLSGLRSDHSAFKDPKTLKLNAAKVHGKEEGINAERKDPLSPRKNNLQIELNREMLGEKEATKNSSSGHADTVDETTMNRGERDIGEPSRAARGGDDHARPAQVKPKLSFSVDSIMSSRSPSDRGARARSGRSVYAEHTSAASPAPTPEQNGLATRTSVSDIDSDSENVDIENVDSDSDEEKEFGDHVEDKPVEDSTKAQGAFLRLSEQDEKGEAQGRRGGFSVDGLLSPDAPGSSSRLQGELPPRPPPHHPGFLPFMGPVNPVDMARWSQFAFPSMASLTPPYLNRKYNLSVSFIKLLVLHGMK